MNVDPEDNQLSARSAKCWSCKSLPAPGSKLRYCGRYETAAYCSKPCARADWDTHKLSCDSKVNVKRTRNEHSQLHGAWRADKDLAGAFARFENEFQSQHSQELLQIIRHRATIVHGCTAPQGSVPFSTRALGNEVAYMLMKTLDLAFDILLTGLRSAAHLNGREGVIRGPDPASFVRWAARLDDGTCVVGTTGVCRREYISYEQL